MTKSDEPVRMNDGLYRWRGLLWTLAKTRKRHDCWKTGKPIEKGDRAFYPLTNGSDRMRRVAASAFQGTPA